MTGILSLQAVFPFNDHLQFKFKFKFDISALKVRNSNLF